MSALGRACLSRIATLPSKLRDAPLHSRAARFKIRVPATAFRRMASGASLFCALGASLATAAESVDQGAAGAFDQWHIVGVGVLVVLQGVLITALLAERRARIKAVAGNVQQRAELAHGSRLAIVGQLYASIAHEINQPLGAILSNADAAEMMLREAAPNVAEVRAILSDIRKDGLRASEVIRHVRTLARKRQVESVPLDLHALCEDVLRLVAPDALRRGITIHSIFEAQAQIVRGDVVYLQQVMLNLVMNAMDALTGIRLAQQIIEVRTSSPRPGEVEVSVRDHGNGVPEPHLHRLFDSFFSTKAHGLGLGLSVVRSIIETHGGHVVAENHPDGGAVFRFTIPTLPAARETAVVALRPARKTA